MARGGINAVRIDAGRLLIHAGSFGQQLAAGLNANIARGEREAQMKPPVGPRGLGAMILGVCHAMRFSRVPRPKMERRSGLSLLRVDSITSSARARSVVGMSRPNCHSSIRDHAGTLP